MTDTLTPGSEWLLPVKITEQIPEAGTVVVRFGSLNRIVLEPEGLPALIPASRLADLEAEVARWQQLYEDARHDLTKAEMEVERLNKALTYEENRSGRIGTHGPGCYLWGPSHYECLKTEFGRVSDLYYDTRDELRAALNPKD
jgi:hypothetical protein